MRNVSYAQALEAAIFEEMKRDDKIYYMGEDVGVFGGAITKLFSLYQNFPERVMDMPLDEKGFTGIAVGMAWMGLRPIVEFMYPDFLVLAMNEIAHGACKEYWLSNQKVPVPMVIRSAQGIGSQCGAHHSECVEGWVMNYPGLKIAVPTFPEDAYGMMKYAIRDNDPVLWLDCRTTCYTEHADIPEAEEDALIPFGQARIRREGTDVTIVAWHKLLKDALAAAEAGADEIDCGLLGMARSAGNCATELAAATLKREGYLPDVDLYGLLDYLDAELIPAMKAYDYHVAVDPTALMLGLSGCHSGFLPLFKKVAAEEGVSLLKLIAEVSAVDRKAPSEELIRQKAAEIRG